MLRKTLGRGRWASLWVVPWVWVVACSSARTDPPPVISQVLVTPDEAAPSGRVHIAVGAHDPLGGALTYRWTSPAGWTVLADDGSALTVEAPARLGETGLVVVDVHDARGGVTTEAAVVRTVQLGALALHDVLIDPNPVRPGGTITVAAVADGNDPSTISYTFSLVGAGWSMTSDGGSATIVAPLAYDRTATLTISASSGGAPAVSRVVLATSAPRRPLIEALTATTTTPAPGAAVDLVALATSPDGLTLRSSWSISDPSWSLVATDSRARVVAPPRPGAAAIVMFTATDAAGATASQQVILTATGDTSAQAISLVATPSTTVAPGGTLALVATANPAASGAPVSFTWSVSDAAWGLSASGGAATLRAPVAYGRVAIVTVTADDGTTPRATARAVISTTPLTPPVITAVTAAPATVAPGGRVSLGVAATSPAGLSLSFAWTSANPDWIVSASGSVATVLAPSRAGDATVMRVTVTDAAGASTSADVAVSTSAAVPIFQSVSVTPALTRPGGDIALAVVAESAVGGPVTFSWSIDNPAWTLVASGGAATAHAPPVFGSVAVVSVTARDALGQTATARILVGTDAVTPPVVSAITAVPQPVALGGNVALAVTASSPLGLPLTYAWSSASTEWVITASGPTATAVAPARSGAATIMRVTVTDSAGASTSAVIPVSTAASPPVFLSVTASPPTTVAPGATVVVTAVARSPLGSPLTLSWAIDNPAWTLTASGATATVKAPAVPGSVAVVTVTARDAFAQSTTTRITLQTGP